MLQKNSQAGSQEKCIILLLLDASREAGSRVRIIDDARSITGSHYYYLFFALSMIIVALMRGPDSKKEIMHDRFPECKNITNVPGMQE